MKKRFSKPWITSAIRVSIRVKNKLYHLGDTNKYKYYRNKITTLTRLSKQMYYQDFFNSNINNMKQTWKGINELINNKKRKFKPITALQRPNHDDIIITNDPLELPDILNHHFATIGNKLANDLPQANSNYTDYLDEFVSPESFSFIPVTSSEVETEISLLQCNKASGLYSMPTSSLLKCAKSVLSKPLAIMNISIQTGKYPSKLKLGKIIPV